MHIEGKQKWVAVVMLTADNLTYHRPVTIPPSPIPTPPFPTKPSPAKLTTSVLNLLTEKLYLCPRRITA